MAIETIRKSTGGPRIRMTACPLCGYEFAPREQRDWHFLRDHTPADIGL